MNLSQSAFTCSKLTIEQLEQGVKYVQVNNKDTRTTTITYFTTCFSVSIVNFKYVIAGWAPLAI